MQSEKFDSENHKADSKDGQSAGETDLHEFLSHEVTEARPDDAEKLKGDEGEAWKDEEGERKAETQDEAQDSNHLVLFACFIFSEMWALWTKLPLKAHLLNITVCCKISLLQV